MQIMVQLKISKFQLKEFGMLEICERYKEVLPNDVEPCDVYVAINAQYHDYAKLFEEWFGGNIDNKVFESAITFWFKDVDFDGDKVWEYFHMNN